MRDLLALFTRSAPRPRYALLVLLGLLLIAPWFIDRYLLSLMILMLYFAFVGQAWNIMMGLAGQLSLGHALYVGLGAYTAAALFQHFGVVPWIGMVAAVAVCVAVASFIGWLAFRFGIGGTYFALLTIAFAEFTRIGFDHFAWVGGSGGFFLKVVQQDRTDWLNLRGHPRMFYFLALALAVLAFLLTAWLMRSRAGYYFRAIRDNEEAARAAGVDTFRYKLFAVQISAALTALAGVFFAFYYNNLFPEQAFSMGRSIEIILAPIIGGIGTLFGPVIGAVMLTVLSEGLTELLQSLGLEAPGLKQILYGVALGLSIMFMPHGVWPALARRLRLGRDDDEAAGGEPSPPEGGTARLGGEVAPPAEKGYALMPPPLLKVRGVSKSFRGLRAVADATLDVAAGEVVALIGPNGAGKTTLFNLIAGAMAPDAGSIRFEQREIAGLRADRVCAAGIGRTFQIVKPFADMSVLENVMVGGFRGTTSSALARDRARHALAALDMESLGPRPASSLTLPDRKRLEVARALATEPRLLLLDEVMAGLRPNETDLMVGAFIRLNREQGLTILLIEHVMRAVMSLAGRVYVLHHGEIIAAGTPQEVTQHPRVLESYLGAEAL